MRERQFMWTQMCQTYAVLLKKKIQMLSNKNPAWLNKEFFIFQNESVNVVSNTIHYDVLCVL